MIFQDCMMAIKVERWEHDWKTYWTEHPHNRRANNNGKKSLMTENIPAIGPLETVKMNQRHQIH